MNEEYTVIGSSTIIEGGNNSINCGGDLVVKGKINGDVIVNGDTAIYGSVNGNVETNDLILKNDAKLNGNVTCKSNLNVNEGAILIGDLKAKNAYLEAEVNGNIEVASELVLSSSAAVVGNIITGSISINAGALLEGNVSIKRK